MSCTDFLKFWNIPAPPSTIFQILWTSEFSGKNIPTTKLSIFNPTDCPIRNLTQKGKTRTKEGPLSKAAPKYESQDNRASCDPRALSDRYVHPFTPKWGMISKRVHICLECNEPPSFCLIFMYSSRKRAVSLGWSTTSVRFLDVFFGSLWGLYGKRWQN